MKINHLLQFWIHVTNMNTIFPRNSYIYKSRTHQWSKITDDFYCYFYSKWILSSSLQIPSTTWSNGLLINSLVIDFQFSCIHFKQFCLIFLKLSCSFYKILLSFMVYLYSMQEFIRDPNLPIGNSGNKQHA